MFYVRDFRLVSNVAPVRHTTTSTHPIFTTNFTANFPIHHDILNCLFINKHYKIIIGTPSAAMFLSITTTVSLLLLISFNFDGQENFLIENNGTRAFSNPFFMNGERKKNKSNKDRYDMNQVNFYSIIQWQESCARSLTIIYKTAANNHKLFSDKRYCYENIRPNY